MFFLPLQGHPGIPGAVGFPGIPGPAVSKTSNPCNSAHQQSASHILGVHVLNQTTVSADSSLKDSLWTNFAQHVNSHVVVNQEDYRSGVGSAKGLAFSLTAALPGVGTWGCSVPTRGSGPSISFSALFSCRQTTSRFIQAKCFLQGCILKSHNSIRQTSQQSQQIK